MCDERDREIARIREHYERTQKIEDDRRLEEYKIKFEHERRLSEIEKETKLANEKIANECQKDIQNYYASSFYGK